MNKNTELISYGAMSIALVYLVTMIAIPTGVGYFNLSDAVIMAVAYTLGPVIGIISALGAVIADFALGYSLFAPFTLVTKMFTGFIIGYIAITKQKEPLPIGAAILAMIVMVLVYMSHDWVVLKIPVNLPHLYTNVMQGIISVIIFVIYKKLRKRA